MTRKPKPLTPRTTRRLVAYAAVAGATAAIGPFHAAAEVVYTPAHAKINTDLYIDLNHDGIGDFHIHSNYMSAIGNLSVFPLVQGNRIVTTPSPCSFRPGNAAALHSGDSIGQGVVFLAKANCMIVDNTGLESGPWYGAKDRYLGFAFKIEGKEHFGWARITTHNLFWRNNQLIGYAYETIPGKPIIAGDQGKSEEVSVPSRGLGGLALGAIAKSLARQNNE